MNDERLPRSVVIGVGLIALATLFLEVTLTRVFAVTLWYHFGFLAISLAMLGTAASAVLVFAYPEQLASAENHGRRMTACALAFALAVPLTMVVHLRLQLPPPSAGFSFYAIFAVQLFLLFVTFLLAGACISIALFRYAKQIGTVYFFDLVGASLGSLLVVPLLFQRSALALIFGVSAVAVLAAAMFHRPYGNRRTQVAFWVGALAFAFLAHQNDRLELLTVDVVKSYSGGKVQMKEPRKLFEKWSPVSRVAVFEPERGSYGWEVMKVTNDGGAPTGLQRFDGNFARIKPQIERDVRQVVHSIKKPGDVLVIGSAGGMDVMVSLAMNHRRITAVEINPVIGDLVTRHFAHYIGDIFQDPRVRLHIQEGRNFAAGSPDRYDIIEITMIDSWGGAAAGAYVFNENSLYTYEGVRDYYRHLKPDGVLSMTRYLDWDEGLRLTATYVKFLRDSGLREIEKRIIVIAERLKGYRRATMLLKRGLFTPEEARTVATQAFKGRGGVIWAPFVDDRLFMVGPGVEPYRELIRSSSEAEFRAALAASPTNITPSTDDTPFFFFTTRLRDVWNPKAGDHPARRVALPLLYGMLGFFAVLAVLTIFVPLILKSGKEIRSAPHALRSLGYFSMLGIGFMLIELSLIQRLTVFLGHPIWSFVVVLTTVLCAGGVGSYLSNRYRDVRHLLNVLLAILALMLVYVLGLYDHLIDLMALPMSLRIALSVAITALPGLLLGMCFPMGMQIAQRFHPALVPWGWGVNGAFSVFASIFSVVIALNAGFKASMSVGIACYAIALAIIWSLRGAARAALQGAS